MRGFNFSVIFISAGLIFAEKLATADSHNGFGPLYIQILISNKTEYKMNNNLGRHRSYYY